MPVVNIDLVRVEKIRGAGNTVEIEATQGNNKIARVLNLDDFVDFKSFASWLINQSPDFEVKPQWQKRIVVTFHVGPDGDKIVDSVTTQDL